MLGLVWWSTTGVPLWAHSYLVSDCRSWWRGLFSISVEERCSTLRVLSLGISCRSWWRGLLSTSVEERCSTLRVLSLVSVVGVDEGDCFQLVWRKGWYCSSVNFISVELVRWQTFQYQKSSCVENIRVAFFNFTCQPFQPRLVSRERKVKEALYLWSKWWNLNLARSQILNCLVTGHLCEVVDTRRSCVAHKYGNTNVSLWSWVLLMREYGNTNVSLWSRVLLKSIVCCSSLFLYAEGWNVDSEEQLIDELDVFTVLTTFFWTTVLRCGRDRCIRSYSTIVASDLGLTPNPLHPEVGWVALSL